MSCNDWHPVARSDELRAGDNIVAGFADGVELALWRAADGSAQAWENRCPHRSVRLTLGQVQGDRLACAYHGWQYAAGSGQCAGIPAHPNMPAPKNVCVKVFRTVESTGMIWINFDPDVPPPPRDDAVPQGWNFCRTLPVRADADTARSVLMRQGFEVLGSSAWRGALGDTPVVALVLDAQARLAFVHLWTAAAPGSGEMKTLHTAARGLRSDIEASAER